MTFQLKQAASWLQHRRWAIDMPVIKGKFDLQVVYRSVRQVGICRVE